MFGPWWTSIRIKERLQELKKRKVEYQKEIRNLEELIKSPEVDNYPRRKLEVQNSITRNQYYLEISEQQKKKLTLDNNTLVCYFPQKEHKHLLHSSSNPLENSILTF